MARLRKLGMRVGSIESHPFAKDAKGWATQANAKGWGSLGLLAALMLVIFVSSGCRIDMHVQDRKSVV